MDAFPSQLPEKSGDKRMLRQRFPARGGHSAAELPVVVPVLEDLAHEFRKPPLPRHEGESPGGAGGHACAAADSGRVVNEDALLPLSLIHILSVGTLVVYELVFYFYARKQCVLFTVIAGLPTIVSLSLIHISSSSACLLLR